LVLGVLWIAAFGLNIAGEPASLPPGAHAALTAALHAPYLLLLCFFAIGLFERIDYLFMARKPFPPGQLPTQAPKVCVQLPMFNEHAVARRVIEAAAAMRWPKDRLVIQVLDDSTDPETQNLVRTVSADVQEKTGVACIWMHREDRAGYKAGALEVGRRQTDAEFIAIFDADFVPLPDFLERAVAHFFKANGQPKRNLALVQAQWGHLNDAQSFLTRAQAMWVDDHHTLQQSWRSAMIRFANFTGTAGVFRASAIEAAGGWRSASLVEDCELSFRVLFAGFRTKFVKEIVAPAELPETFAAYRSQQRRWTLGWAQLQRMHMKHLVFDFKTSLLRKIYLIYMMGMSWQWPLWIIWLSLFPFLISHGLWLGAVSMSTALLVYALPPLAFAFFAGLLATIETSGNQSRGRSWNDIVRRTARIFPYLVVNASMVAHHACAFIEGMFGPMHAEFERTPKSAAVNGVRPSDSGPVGAIGTPTVTTAPAKATNRAHYKHAYHTAEAALFATQLAWAIAFLMQGYEAAAIGSLWLVACIAGVRLSVWGAHALQRRSTNKSRI
jgi:cellulose synthase/poly-beta-1,6-N-acetylglucosamine synthase-like glycosyltransferase